MVKSLGDYNIEQSSSSGFGKIKWSKRKQADNKPKKNTKKISPTNIIYTNIKVRVKKIFKIENVIESEPKNENTNKRFQNSSATKSKIKPGFKRPAR